MKKKEKIKVKTEAILALLLGKIMGIMPKM